MQCKKNSLVATERDLGAMDDGCRKCFSRQPARTSVAPTALERIRSNGLVACCRAILSSS